MGLKWYLKLNSFIKHVGCVDLFITQTHLTPTQTHLTPTQPVYLLVVFVSCRRSWLKLPSRYYGLSELFSWYNVIMSHNVRKICNYICRWISLVFEFLIWKLSMSKLVILKSLYWFKLTNSFNVPSFLTK